ncbi:hypothetical protein P3W45_000778 [Vairimorpha bombi]|jgi:ubiquitin-conjugating enzyme E2 M
MSDSFSLYRINNELSSLILLEDTSYIIDKENMIIYYSMNIKEGIYINRSVSFSIFIPPDYPFVSPKIKCTSRILHPSIDQEGNTCLEILRHNWKCTYGIQNIFINLYTIFIEVECDNPLNVEVGDLMKENWDEYVRQARNYQ